MKYSFFSSKWTIHKINEKCFGLLLYILGLNSKCVDNSKTRWKSYCSKLFSPTSFLIHLFCLYSSFILARKTFPPKRLEFISMLCSLLSLALWHRIQFNSWRLSKCIAEIKQINQVFFEYERSNSVKKCKIRTSIVLAFFFPFLISSLMFVGLNVEERLESYVTFWLMGYLLEQYPLLESLVIYLGMLIYFPTKFLVPFLFTALHGILSNDLSRAIRYQGKILKRLCLGDQLFDQRGSEKFQGSKLCRCLECFSEGRLVEKQRSHIYPLTRDINLDSQQYRCLDMESSQLKTLKSQNSRLKRSLNLEKSESSRLFRCVDIDRSQCSKLIKFLGIKRFQSLLIRCSKTERSQGAQSFSSKDMEGYQGRQSSRRVDMEKSNGSQLIRCLDMEGSKGRQSSRCVDKEKPCFSQLIKCMDMGMEESQGRQFSRRIEAERIGVVSKLDKEYHTYQKIIDCCQQYSNCCQIDLCLLFSVFFGCVFTGMGVVMMRTGNPRISLAVESMLTMTACLVAFVHLVSTTSGVPQAMSDMGEGLKKTLRTALVKRDLDWKSLMLLKEVSEIRPVHMNVCGVLDIKRSLILSCFGCTITYCLLIMQLKRLEPN